MNGKQLAEPDRQLPKARRPTFGIVSVAGPLLAVLVAAAWVMLQPYSGTYTSRADDNFAYRMILTGNALTYFVGPCFIGLGLVPAIMALVKREPYRILPVLGLLLGLLGCALVPLGFMWVIISYL